MRIYKNAWFGRFARKQGIADSVLVETIRRIEKGQIDVSLGAGVFKQRIARPGRGRSGGYRVIILYRRAYRAFFIYGFAKNERDDIDVDEEDTFRKAARHILGLSDEHLAQLIRNKRFSEVSGDG